MPSIYDKLIGKVGAGRGLVSGFDRSLIEATENRDYADIIPTDLYDPETQQGLETIFKAQRLGQQEPGQVRTGSGGTSAEAAREFLAATETGDINVQRTRRQQPVGAGRFRDLSTEFGQLEQDIAAQRAEDSAVVPPDAIEPPVEGGDGVGGDRGGAPSDLGFMGMSGLDFAKSGLSAFGPSAVSGAVAGSTALGGLRGALSGVMAAAPLGLPSLVTTLGPELGGRAAAAGTARGTAGDLGFSEQDIAQAEAAAQDPSLMGALDPAVATLAQNFASIRSRNPGLLSQLAGAMDLGGFGVADATAADVAGIDEARDPEAIGTRAGTTGFDDLSRAKAMETVAGLGTTQAMQGLQELGLQSQLGMIGRQDLERGLEGLVSAREAELRGLDEQGYMSFDPTTGTYSHIDPTDPFAATPESIVSPLDFLESLQRAHEEGGGADTGGFGDFGGTVGVAGETPGISMGQDDPSTRGGVRGGGPGGGGESGGFGGDRGGSDVGDASEGPGGRGV